MLVFLADGGVGVGLGHLMRCLALAAAARAAGHRVTLLTGTADLPALDLWRAQGCDVQAFRSDQAAAVIAAAQGAALVIDRYDLPPGFHAALAAAGLTTLVLDDLGAQDPPCTLLVNPNPGADHRFAHSYTRAKKCLLGAPHALIRPGLDAASGGAGVLVTLGGSGLDAQLADLALAIAGPVVAAGRGPRPQGLPDRITWHAGADLAPLLAACDLVLCGGGVTAVEACALGRPALLLVLADNQAPGAAALAAAGAARITTPADAPAQVARLLADPALRARMGQAGRALIDGRGAARVLAALPSFA